MSGSALISVFDKTGLDGLVRAFTKHNVEILGSGGTADAVRKLGNTVVDVSDYTGFPEMPSGLVKTLHPKIHAGILGDWNDPEQRKYLEANHVRRLDFVVVNLYPFQEVVKSDPTNMGRAIDNIDIGGVALIRAAAKGALLNKRVVPLTSPHQYPKIATELDEKGKVENKTRVELAGQAFALTAEYDSAIRDYLGGSAK